MQIWELETNNDRVFRVATENKSQENRLKNIIATNKSKSYEVFVSIKVITNGIHDIKEFEDISETLV